MAVDDTIDSGRDGRKGIKVGGKYIEVGVRGGYVAGSFVYFAQLGKEGCDACHCRQRGTKARQLALGGESTGHTERDKELTAVVDASE